MKKYLVSLALKVPCNFEIETKANSKKEALGIALKKWNSKDYTESNITEPIWEEDLTLDIDTKNNIYTLGNGINIQEIEI